MPYIWVNFVRFLTINILKLNCLLLSWLLSAFGNCNKSCYTLLWEYNFQFVCKYLEGVIAGSYSKSTFNFYKELPNCLSMWLYYFTFLLVIYESSYWNLNWTTLNIYLSLGRINILTCCISESYNLKNELSSHLLIVDFFSNIL